MTVSAGDTSSESRPTVSSFRRTGPDPSERRPCGRGGGGGEAKKTRSGVRGGRGASVRVLRGAGGVPEAPWSIEEVSGGLRLVVRRLLHLGALDGMTVVHHGALDCLAAV